MNPASRSVLLLAILLTQPIAVHADESTVLARKNAIEGLLVAVDQLQQHAGKDQAVTFPATTYYPTKDVTKGTGDLYDNLTYGYRSKASRANQRSYLNKATTYLVPSERQTWDTALKSYWNASRNPRWTGIMDTSLRVDRATNPNGPSVPLPAQRYEENPSTKFGEPKRDQLPIWLVSGNEKFTIAQETDTSYPPGYQTPDTVLPNPVADPSVVYLVGAGSATDATQSADGMDGRVKARKQPVPQVNPTGNYAYWVGDESLKANFAMRDPYKDAAPGTPEYKHRLLAPQRAAWENQSGIEEAIDIDPQDAKLRKLHSTTQLSKLDPNIPAKENFHDLTPHSKSLFTDTALGGLKKDLTSYLETNQGLLETAPIANPNLYDPNDPRFRAWGGTNTGFPNTSAEALDGIPTWGNVRDWYTNVSNGSGAISPNENIAPVMTYIMFHSGLSYDPATKRIRWHWLPCIVLWNPYDVPLSSATYDMEVGISPAIWQMMFVQENNTLAELQRDLEADWREVTVPGGSGIFGPDGREVLNENGTSYINSSSSPKTIRIFKGTYTGITGTRYFAQIIPISPKPAPDYYDMNKGPWSYDTTTGLQNGTTDAFGRFFYYGAKTDPFIRQSFQSTGIPGNYSSLGTKAILMSLSPHESSATLSEKLPVDRPLKFNITDGFGPGEARIYTVPNNVEWSTNETITLTNQFNPTTPASLWFDILNLAQGPTSAWANIKWYYSLHANSTCAPTVKFSINGKTIMYTEKGFGSTSFNSLQWNIMGKKLQNFKSYSMSGYDSMDFDKDGIVNRDEAMPSFVSEWRQLYDFNEFDQNQQVYDTRATDSSIFGYGSSFIAPLLGTGDINTSSHHAYLPVLSRFNIFAKSYDSHPMVDYYRSTFGANNFDYNGDPEGLSKFLYIRSEDNYQSKWNDLQHDGNKGFAMVTERNFAADSISDDRSNFKALSTLSIRNAGRTNSELLSLGQLQQINLSHNFWQPSFPIGNSDASVYTDREAIAGIHSRKVGTVRDINGNLTGSSIAYPAPNVKPNNDKRTDNLYTISGTFQEAVKSPGNTMLDLSYLLNENLWDQFFLSSNSSLIPSLPLPNGRIKFTHEAASAGSLLTNFDTSSAYLENQGALNINSTSVESWKSLLTAFRDLKIQSQAGDSNPNGTTPITRSVSPIQDKVDFTFDTNLNTAQRSDYGNLTGSGSKDYTKVLGGFRYLTDDMIQSLSERIVDEIRMRGPFLSLSDFVNRRLVAPVGSGVLGSFWYSARTSGKVGTETANVSIPVLFPADNQNDFINPDYDPFVGLQGLNGTLQRALNLSGINGGVNHPKYGLNGTNSGDTEDRVYGVRIKNYGTDDYEGPASHTNSGIGGGSNTTAKHSIEPAMRGHVDMEHLAGAPAGEAGQIFQGAPGFVTQGDLLSMIGSALTPRGDTFLVRAYGDSVDANGSVKSHARLEALVQRTIEPVSPAGASGADRFRPTTPRGRKMKIIGFRWLEDDEH